jgi:hypothetical protein
MSMPEAAGRMSTEGVALNWLRPFWWVVFCHSSSAWFASFSVSFTTASWMDSMVL